MRLIKVAAGIVNQTPLDWNRNRDNILAVLTWCRFPILSGGFEKEVAELHAFVRSTGVHA